MESNRESEQKGRLNSQRQVKDNKGRENRHKGWKRKMKWSHTTDDKKSNYQNKTGSGNTEDKKTNIGKSNR